MRREIATFAFITAAVVIAFNMPCLRGNCDKSATAPAGVAVEQDEPDGSSHALAATTPETMSDPCAGHAAAAESDRPDRGDGAQPGARPKAASEPREAQLAAAL